MDSEGKTEKKRLGCLGRIFVGTALLVAAYYTWRAYQHYDIDRKYEYAMRQCEKYGGQQGEIPVVTEGVYDHRRTSRSHDILERASIFLNNGLRYVEFSSDVINLYAGRRYGWRGPLFRKGSLMFDFYRVYIAKRGDPLCESYTALLKEGHTIFNSAGLSDSECVAIKGFDEPSEIRAPYELVLNDREINEGVSIEWKKIEIVDRSTQEAIANYSFFSHCFTKMKKNYSEGFKYCAGSYGNPKVWPTCPSDSTKASRGIELFENSAFKL